MLGELNATIMSVDHTLSDEERDGLLHTENDQLTPTIDALLCFTGTP